MIKKGAFSRLQIDDIVISIFDKPVETSLMLFLGYSIEGKCVVYYIFDPEERRFEFEENELCPPSFEV